MRLWTVPFGLGAISVASRPLGDELLPGELDEIRDAGVTVLVSMLADDELPILGLEHEELTAPFVGLRFLRVPTPDQTAPARDRHTLDLLGELASNARAGDHVAVHCHAGQGRSPAFACAILVLGGVGADTAMRTVSDARGRSVPELPAQAEWVHWVELQVMQT